MRTGQPVRFYVAYALYIAACATMGGLMARNFKMWAAFVAVLFFSTLMEIWRKI